MLAMSTDTVPLRSWVRMAVPIGAPAGLYMMTFAAATASRARCADEHATAASAMLKVRKGPGSFIVDSAKGMALLISNLELRPDHNAVAIAHRALVLRRRARPRVNLDSDDLATVDELIDVAGL